MNRRSFLQTSAASLLPLRAASPDSRIDILTAEPIAPIAPEIYGHFVEHLGGVVYDGIWVGPNSPIPNIGGLRKQLIDALARIRPGVIRWPGGCFADQYDWRDGIGPQSSRPRRTNFWAGVPEWPKAAKTSGPHLYDPNHFGTLEFARLCQLTRAEPYFAANLRSLPAQDYWRWVEFCNSPAGSTTLAGERAAAGHPNPLNVRYWGVGNESWGCGGNFEPEEYAVEFKRYSTWVPDYGLGLRQIPSGPSDADYHWTRKFLEKARKSMGAIWGMALHHYSWNASAGRTNDWQQGKRDAVNFDTEQYYEILREAQQTEPFILGHWRAIGEFDPARRIRLVVDEWGSWYAPGTEPFPEALIGQQNTMRDAVLAGLTLDIFQRHADKIGMANIAQLVNCLQSLFLAHEDRFCLTPTYHVFDMYAAHQRATALRTVVSSPAVHYHRNAKAATLEGLNGSASLKANTLILTVTNTNIDTPCEAQIAIHGATPTSLKATTLAAKDPRAHNTFSNPNAVQPTTQTLPPKPTHTFPPASVTKLEYTLA